MLFVLKERYLFLPSTRLKKLIDKKTIYFFKNGSTRMKLKYLIQVNQLYLADDLKEIINTKKNIKQTQISISTKIKWSFLKNDFGDKILKLHFYYQGSTVIDKKLVELGPQLEALFKSSILDSNNYRDYMEYQLLIKESPNEEYYIPQPEKNIPVQQSKIKLSKYYYWEFEKHPHLLLSGNSGTGKSYQIYEIISETMKITNNIYICDGKNDELTLYSKNLFKLKNIANNEKDINDMINLIAEEMNKRFSERQLTNKIISFEPLFLIIDEYTSLKLTMDKKDYSSMEQTIKRLILKARSANIHLVISLQRASAENMNLDIRDNCSIKIGFGSLSVENYKMIFNENITKDRLKNKDIGQGYIYINGIIQDFKAFDICIENIEATNISQRKLQKNGTKI